jgi:hypothetical protein
MVAVRLAARERYRAEHPEFDDPELRASVRAARRAAERGEKRQRYEAWWAGLSPAERADFRRREKGRGGKPMRRHRMEELRRSWQLQGWSDPPQWQVRETVRESEREERAEYKAAQQDR